MKTIVFMLLFIVCRTVPRRLLAVILVRDGQLLAAMGAT